MIDTLMHYPETPRIRLYTAKSAFTEGFLTFLSNHEGAFHGPGGH